MKNFIVLALLIMICSFSANSQTASINEPKADEIPYKNYKVNFILDSETPDQVGFDNSKSYWQFRYELRFLEKDFKFEYFREKENESQKEREKRIERNNKQYDKGWKKNGFLVFKGKIPKTPIANAANREITVPLDLPPQIAQILAKAGSTWGNPDFRVSMRGKAYLIDASGKKSKQKLSISFVCPTKMITKDAQYWTINSCGIYHEITKISDGRIIVGLKLRI